MKLNPLPWIEKWLSQPSDFWLALNDFQNQAENQLLTMAKEKQDDLDFEAARKLADDLFGIKS